MEPSNQPLRVMSLFSGSGGLDLGLERAGMTCVGQVEIDPQARGVLARHWPEVPRWEDVTEVTTSDLPTCDVLTFGSPCQDLSFANPGRDGLAGNRSNLFYQAIRIIKEYQHDGRGPALAVWENVVGAFSSASGHDFAAVLDSLAEAGAVDIEWRVLDAQWFGVAQRRRRLFLTARFDTGGGGGRPVLPDGAEVYRDHGTCREAGSGIATGPHAGANPGVDGDGPTRGLAPGASDREVLVFDTTQVTHRLNYSNPKPGDPSHPLTAYGDAPTLLDFGVPGETPARARRLTPRECERLMGWPDDWTRWTADGTELPITSRYRMCGNGVVSPVGTWLGTCITEALTGGCG